MPLLYMNDQEIIKESLFVIAKRLGYSNIDRITQRDYDHISDQISEQTGILISSSTVKRLMNGKFSRMPQVATLNAIAVQLGFKTWQEYRVSLQEVASQELTSGVEASQEVTSQDEASFPDAPFRETSPETAPFKKEQLAETSSGETLFVEPPVKTQRLSTAMRGKPTWFASGVITIAGITLIVLVIAGFLRFRPQRTFSDARDAKFSARKASRNDIPATVVFNYDIDKIAGDSFFIQQSWDRNRRVRIYKNKYVLTDIYYEPGYHIAKLIANDSVIRTVDISIPTSGWFVYAKEAGQGGTTEYISGDSANSTVADGSFKITKAILDHQNIDITKEKVFVYAFFPENLQVNSDNFSLKTRVRMKEIRKNFCPYITLDIFTQRYTMFVNTMPPGCSSELNLQFGDRFVSGKDTDLTGFGQDVTQWMDLKITILNRKATVFINEKEVYSTTYSHTSKLITGMAFLSNGLCEIDHVSLKGGDGNIVYENDFDADGKAQIAQLNQ